jgi:hypothetical protein
MGAARARAVPAQCAFSGKPFYYADAFEAPLGRVDLSAAELYREIFSHYPAAFKWLLVARGWLVAPFGLRRTTLAQLDGPRFRVYSERDEELVAGGDDRHLDFRVSVLKLREHGAEKVVLSTVVQPHNHFGRAYLRIILPFHRFGVRTLLSNAVAARRL